MMSITHDSSTGVSLPALLSNQSVSERRAFSDALSAMQQQYALLRMVGTFYAVDIKALATLTDRGIAPKFEPLKRSDATLLIIREVTKQFPGVNGKLVAKDFFVSPKTVCHLGVEFNPAGSSENFLNLWVASTITPRDGSAKLIREYLLNGICSGNKRNFRYLVKYLAHALQRPWEKPGVMIILLGGQGTGKGTLAYILHKIWSATYLQVHQVKSVTGSFNASLERAFIVWLDEVIFAGNRSATDSLKSLVTEPVIHINEKFQPARQINSFHRFFGASNSDFYKATDHDDRRDFVLRVSDDHKDDHEYWNALYSEIDNGGVEALVHILLKKDLSSFNVREKPSTDELMRQKLKSLTPVPRWWYDCLCRNEIIAGSGWPKFVSTDSVINEVFDTSCGKLSQKPAAIEVAKFLAEFCPSLNKKQTTIDGARQRGFLLPILKQARAEFETYMGGELTW
jgi:hypothetical protein